MASPDAAAASAPATAIAEKQLQEEIPGGGHGTDNTSGKDVEAGPACSASAPPLELEDELDLSTEHGVQVYLAQTPFAAAREVKEGVKALSGGSANYVFRVVLERPYMGRRTVVVKHAKPYVKDNQGVEFWVERQIYEVEALRRVKARVPAGSLVTVPEVHLFDKEANVIIMDDAGEGSLRLKDFMIQGKATVEMAKAVGDGLGLFLGDLHKWGRGNEELCKLMKENVQAKQMAAWYYYGTLKATVEGNHKVEKLLNPPLVIDEGDVKTIVALADDTIERILAEEHSHIMGDFWPGNMMVALDKKGELKNVFVVDWEMTKTGLPGLDVGQFSAEIHMLRRFHAEVCGETATALLDHFLAEYKKTAEPSAEDLKYASVQFGTHQVVLAGRVDWGEKELTRSVVKDAVQVLCRLPYPVIG